MSYHPRIEDLTRRRLVGKDGVANCERNHFLVEDEIVAKTTSLDYEPPGFPQQMLDSSTKRKRGATQTKSACKTQRYDSERHHAKPYSSMSSSEAASQTRIGEMPITESVHSCPYPRGYLSPNAYAYSNERSLRPAMINPSHSFFPPDPGVYPHYGECDIPFYGYEHHYGNINARNQNPSNGNGWWPHSQQTGQSHSTDRVRLDDNFRGWNWNQHSPHLSSPPPYGGYPEYFRPPIEPIPSYVASVNTADLDEQDSTGFKPRPPVDLYLPCDDDSLSDYQCLIRKQIELFEAGPEDVRRNAQGRNRAITLGQVGIRCKYCSYLEPAHRDRGAVYFPSKLNGIYQAGQNMASIHLSRHCRRIPVELKREILRLVSLPKSSAGSGKKYWGDGARALGVIEEHGRLRFE